MTTRTIHYLVDKASGGAEFCLWGDSREDGERTLHSLADDGLDGLDVLRAGHFDVVLMDVHMPRMDGIEALRRIRAGEAGPRGVPVLALTADAMSDECERLIAQGFDDVHPKPIQPAELMFTVAAWCARADQAAVLAATAA